MNPASCIVAIAAITGIVVVEVVALFMGHNGLILSGSVGSIVAVAFKREEIYAKLRLASGAELSKPQKR